MNKRSEPITYENAVSVLLEAFPEMPSEYRDEEDIAEKLPYRVYGIGGFSTWLIHLLDSQGNDELIRKCFDFLNDLTNRGRTGRSVAAVGVLENLEISLEREPTEARIERATTYMTPNLLYLWAELEAFWNGTSEYVYAHTKSPWPEVGNM